MMDLDLKERRAVDQASWQVIPLQSRSHTFVCWLDIKKRKECVKVGGGGGGKEGEDKLLDHQKQNRLILSSPSFLFFFRIKSRSDNNINDSSQGMSSWCVIKCLPLIPLLKWVRLLRLSSQNIQRESSWSGSPWITLTFCSHLDLSSSPSSLVSDPPTLFIITIYSHAKENEERKEILTNIYRDCLCETGTWNKKQRKSDCHSRVVSRSFIHSLISDSLLHSSLTSSHNFIIKRFFTGWLIFCPKEWLVLLFLLCWSEVKQPHHHSRGHCRPNRVQEVSLSFGSKTTSSYLYLEIPCIWYTHSLLLLWLTVAVTEDRMLKDSFTASSLLHHWIHQIPVWRLILL